ncbi:MAG: DivIVA domain-containing protein [Nakamurella sp.]
MTGPTSGFQDLDTVTGADLRSVTFATSRARGRGYDEQQVASYVANCAAVVDRLRDHLARQAAHIGQLQGRIDRDSRSNEVAHAISVLTTAQQTADRTVSEADGYSARVMSEARDLYEDARRNAGVLEQETEDKSRAVYEDAVSRATAIEKETIAKIEQLELTSMSAQKELDSQTAYLRTLRDATRTQMEAFLEGLLDRVAEEYGRAHPLAAAEASNRNGQPRGRRVNRLPARQSGGPGKPSSPTVRIAGLPERRRSANGAIPLPRAQPADQSAPFGEQLSD